MKKNFILILFLTIFLPSVSYSQIVVPNYFQIIKSTDKPIRNMTVLNQGKAPLLVNTYVDVSLIGKDGKEYKERTMDLIVAPKNFPIGPNEKKNIRILVRKPKDNVERFYRITFAPKPLTSEHPQNEYNYNEKTIGIRTVSGMVATVYAEPTKREIDIVQERNKDICHFENKGNYHSRFFDVKICNTSKEDKSCKDVEKIFTLRPGQKKDIKVPQGKFLVYKEKQTVGGKVFERHL